VAETGEVKRLGIGVAATGAVWIGLQFHASKRNDPIDVAVVSAIALTMLSASVVMVLFTRTWSARGVGVFLATLGTGILYGAAMYARIAERTTTPEWLIDMARSAYLVGSPLFLYGLAIWVWQRVVMARDVSPDPAPPEVGL
jgi:hypothetical protein